MFTDGFEKVGKVLTTKARKKIPTSEFALPPDRYPINDASHAKNALARSSGKPEEGKVRAAVYRRFPELKKHHEEREGK